MKKISSLYVHIPFCEHICNYCDFCKVFYNENICDKYLDVLLNELYSCKIDNKLKTIYIGAVSPSILNNNQLERLLNSLHSYLDKDYEFSVEVNPENINEEKIELLKKYGVNRVSIGIQTFNKKIIEFLGRKHSYDDVKKCVKLLNDTGITNYSFDFIYGINEQAIENINTDLELAFSLKPKHLSLYSLILEDNTILKINKYKELDEDTVREHYDFIYDKLKEKGFNRYEVSNFALNGYECKHNLVYWNNEEYYAIGVSASSYVNGFRYTTNRNISDYLKGVIKKEKYEVEKEKEYIMLKLRLDEGINLIEYKSIFLEDFLLKYGSVVNEMIVNNLLEVKDNYLKTTYDGMLLLDSILLRLM